MNNIINKARQFKYSSLEYVDPDDLSNPIISIDNNKCLILYSKEDEKVRLDWATNSKEDFFIGLKETINLISQDKTIKKMDIEFIPEHYVGKMEDLGFIITSGWVDFWNNKLATISLEYPDSLIIRKIKDEEYEIASEITRSCRGYSRGYEGETFEWIKEWNESENACIFVAEMNDKIIGICCVSLYGFESEKGIILWLREVAVEPRYHSQKIGLNLVAFGMNWGKNNGAVRSFLACDMENKTAIKLYEGLGYERKTKRGQINMRKIF